MPLALRRKGWIRAERDAVTRPGSRLGGAWLVAVLLLSALLVGGVSTPSKAAAIGIRFDISQSWVSLLGGTIVIPPDGVLSSQLFRVVVPASTGATIQSGTAIVKGLGFDLLSIDKLILSAAHVTGSVGVDQIGQAAGMLQLNGTGNPASVKSLGLNMLIAPNVQCMGAACSLIGSFPFTTPQNQILTGTLTIANLTQTGAASFDQSFSVTLSGLTGIVRLIGHEVQRTFVPEPSSASLIGLGLLAAAAAGRVTSKLRKTRRA